MVRQINIKEGYLSIIHEASKSLSKNTTFKESLKDILKILYSYWDAPVSFIALYSKENSELKIVESFGLTKMESKKGVFKKGEGIVGNIFKNDLPAIIYDIKSSSRYLNKINILSKFEKNMIFIGTPIKVGRESFGVLGVYKEKTRNFSYDDALKMLSTLSTIIGLAKKMHDRMEEERQYWQEEKQILLSNISQKDSALNNIIGISETINNIRKTISRVANIDSTIFITGESGTGKTLIAKTIHMMSSRRNNFFATINCAAIPENLLESELFGYEKGAFSGAYAKKKGKFELADKGTLFLDEIGDMPLSLQAKLLNVIQDREISRLGSEETIHIDTRIITATNKNMEKLIKIGQFREDLYYRINILPMHIPPLRDRRDDIPVLIDFVLKRLNKKYKKRIVIDSLAIKDLINYDWPGNIRELENTLERLIVMNDKTIKQKDLPNYIVHKQTIDESVNQKDVYYKDIPYAIKNIEKKQIQDALKETGYVKSKAARLLGFTIRQLDYRIKKYNLNIKKF